MNIKGRNFAFIIYPDSCAFSYCDMISELKNIGVSMAISPLHIPDNDNKKPHYHILMHFDGVKTIDSVKDLYTLSGNYVKWKNFINCKGLSNQEFPHFVLINSIAQYFRYLLHLDDEKKQQFPDFQILNEYVSQDNQKLNSLVLLNAFDCKDYLDRNTRLSPEVQILELIKNNEFKNLNQLISFLSYSKNVYLLTYIKKNMYFVKNFLCNFREEVKENTTQSYSDEELKRMVQNVY